MRKRLFRFRRVAVAALTGTTVVTGMTLIGVGAGTAFAVDAPSTMVGAGAPVAVVPNATDEPVGNFYASFVNTWADGNTITFAVLDHNGNCGNVTFHNLPTVTVTNTNAGTTTPVVTPTFTTTCSGTDTLTLTLSGGPATGTATDVWDITVSNIEYNVGSDAADGNVQVSADGAEASVVSGAGATSLSSPSGTSAVSNASVVGIELGADEPTNVTAPGTAQPVADFLGSITNSFVAGSIGTLEVSDNTETNCTPTETIGFAGTPTVTVTAAQGNTGTGETAPIITAAYSSSSGACTTNSIKDVLTLTVTNGATGLTTDDAWNFDVSGVEYTVGATAALGSVAITMQGVVTSDTVGDGLLAAPSNTTPVSNAIVSNVVMGANSPPVAIDLQKGNNFEAANVPISPITFTEQSAGLLPAGTAPDNYICIEIFDSSINTSTSVPVASASGGGAAVGTASVINGDEIVFPITTPSSSTPATYTVSGINVNTDTHGFNYAQAWDNSNSACSSTGPSIGDVPAYYAAETHHIFGATADDTAAAELQYFNEFNSGCVDNNGDSVVLTRDDLPYDALAGAYLAGQLDTGTLLTPGGLNGTVSDATLNAIRLDGVQTVYVLGGPGAISYPIVAQLETTQAYECGGTETVQQANSLANPVYLNVIRIWGNTADDTASDIGQFFGSTDIGSASISGAYGTTFNDTGGAQSLPPVPGNYLRTAIVATDNGWQDATSAGPISWRDEYPIVLTPQGGLGSAASSALSNLGIQQVIVMGGQAAVSDAVVGQIESLGIPVLRIAGHDFTDTSQLTARFAQSDVGLDWDSPDVYVARGDYFGDALAGAVDAGGHFGYPLLLSQDSTTMGPGMATYFSQAGLMDGVAGDSEAIRTLRILGGPAAFAETLVQQLLNLVSAGDNGT